MAPDRQHSQAEVLVATSLEAGDELFHDTHGQAFARIVHQGHVEVHKLRKRGGYRQHLIRRYFEEHGRPPNAQALEAALATLEATAVLEGDEHPVFVRVAPHPLRLGAVVDLGDAEWNQVEVDASGWRVLDEPLVRFRRPPTSLALPTPIPGGNLEDMRQFVNVTDASWPTLVAFLLGTLMPQGPYPILALVSQHGSGKSFTARLTKSLMDPSVASLRAAPRDERDLLIGARNSWCLAFDNLATLSPNLSDAFCRLSTGGGISTRELFTDEGEFILEAMRPVILTGIDDLATRGDLLDRSLPVELPGIDPSRRRTETELREAFTAVHPQLLGALLSCATEGFRHLPVTQPEDLPRLADFGRWVVAAEPATGLDAGRLSATLARVQEEAATTALEAHPLSAAIRQLLEDEGEYEGRATDLLARLSRLASSSARRSKAWPKSASALGGALRRLAPSLEELGVHVTSKRPKGVTTWRLAVFGSTTAEHAATRATRGATSAYANNGREVSADRVEIRATRVGQGTGPGGGGGDRVQALSSRAASRAARLAAVPRDELESIVQQANASFPRWWMSTCRTEPLAVATAVTLLADDAEQRREGEATARD